MSHHCRERPHLSVQLLIFFVHNVPFQAFQSVFVGMKLADNVHYANFECLLGVRMELSKW